jgi:hypothetical protein
MVVEEDDPCLHVHVRARISTIIDADLVLGLDGTYDSTTIDTETDYGTSAFECRDCGKILFYDDLRGRL